MGVFLAMHGVVATVRGEEIVIALVASRRMEVRVQYLHRESGAADGRGCRTRAQAPRLSPFPRPFAAGYPAARSKAPLS